LGVVRTLMTSAVVGATGSARAGMGVAELTARRVPSLLVLGARASVTTGPGAARAETTFRDELLTLLDDAAGVASRQARRARLELGDRTSPSGASRRRHRVKT
jgi:hypothetical protein